MTAFATTDDVAAAWRALTDEEFVQASFYLDFASEIIRIDVPSVDSRLAAGTLSAGLLTGIATAMVLRVMKNPDGYRQVQESIEDYSTTKVRDNTLSTGGLYLAEDECRLLAPRSGAFSVTPSPEPTTYAIIEQVARRRAMREAAYLGDPIVVTIDQNDLGLIDP